MFITSYQALATIERAVSTAYGQDGPFFGKAAP
jgi:hypothetical protein